MARVRKTQFYLDNASSALTEYTDDINQAALNRAVEVLEDTALNDNDTTHLSGIRSAELPLNGYYNDTASGVVDVLVAAQGTSVTKTFAYKVGNDYYTGESLLTGLEISSDGKKIVPWSTTLKVTGAVTKTSVLPT